MRRAALLLALAATPLAAIPLAAQQRDTVSTQDRIYTRPFIGSVGRTAIGGYVEGNTTFSRANGVSEGFSIELRRFNVFLFSGIGSRIRFISELELEHGTEEIALETALVDFTVNPSLVLRGGIILPPIGAFNVSHDSPRWEFIDRPLVATQVIPSTLSEVGFGAHGRLVPRGFQLTYDAYLVNGLGDGVILNSDGRTSLAAGKDEERFGEDNNGRPAFAARLAAQHATLGELGLSFYGGTYNTFAVDGEPVDDRRGVRIVALDVATMLGPVEARGEAALAAIDVPRDLRELFAERQAGFHLDLAMPLYKPRLRGLPDAVVKGALRIETVDLNIGSFGSTGDPIGDQTRAIVAGLSFHPLSGTVLKVNYRRSWTRDFRNNAPTRLGAVQVGFATYF